MSIQSNVQQLLQASSGLQTQAQANVPSGVNNGNPNSVYNWSSYIPSILRNSAGTPTGANFDLITSQPQASAPGTGWNTGYTPPFAADPFAAMLMSQLSQYRGPSASQLPGYGAGNPMIDNILRNLIGGYVSAPAPGTTAPGTTTPPGAGTPGTGTPSPGTGQPGTGTPVGTQGPNSGEGIPVQWSDYTASPIVGGGGNVGTGGSGVIGGGSSNLPSGTYTPNYGNFDNTGTVGPIWGNNAFGSNFDTSVATGTNQSGGWRGALSGAWNGLREALAPANASSGGPLSDFAATMALRAGYNTQTNDINLMDGAATLAGGPAALAPGMIYDVGTGVVGGAMAGWRGGSPSLDGAAGTPSNPAQGFGFGDVSGGWNVNDVYTPSPIVNADFSTTNPSDTAAPFDIEAWLANAPQSYQGDGTAPANTAPVTTQPVIRANLGSVTNRTPAEEAAYAAQLTMQSNLAAQRYGSNINMGNLPAEPVQR